MHFSIPDTQECKEDNGSTYVVSIKSVMLSALIFATICSSIYVITLSLITCILTAMKLIRILISSFTIKLILGDMIWFRGREV